MNSSGNEKKICVLTATRAEYGLLKNVIISLKEKAYDVRVAVTGTHLSESYGYTVQEIEQDGIPIDVKINILSDSDNTLGISKTMASAIEQFAEYFDRSFPELLVVLGDRYETLAVCIAAMNARIPIAHIHGGETTEGAIDECIRHAITKMSYLHFTSCEEYRRRVIQLGESPERVFNVGGLGVENIKRLKYMPRERVLKKLHLSKDKSYAVVTFHPVTLEENTCEEQINALLCALDAFPDKNFVITKANADAGGKWINQCLEKYAKDSSHVELFDSLGMVLYLNALKYAEMVIGNSSSGILEAPSFGIPTVNIGDRQKGRIQADSVINCPSEKGKIIEAIQKAESGEFQKIAHRSKSPYGDGNTSGKIANIVDDFLSKDKICLKKNFYDLHL